MYLLFGIQINSSLRHLPYWEVVKFVGAHKWIIRSNTSRGISLYDGDVFMTVISILVAFGASFVIFRIGMSIFRILATPLPEPPPAGELRKVKLNYRCSLCGSEVRMTIATEEEPDPPRHCMTEMDLIIEEE
jgi:hypothetical protein